MSMTSGPGRLWLRVRGLPRRVPLRLKLITAVLALVAIALAIISVVGISVLRGYLLGPVDSQFPPRRNMEPIIANYLESGSTELANNGTSVTWTPSGGTPQQVITPISIGTGPGRFGRLPFTPSPIPGPKAPASPHWLHDHTSQPATVPALSGGGEWRVLAYDLRFTRANGTTVSGYAVVGQDITSQYRTLARLWEVDLLVSGIVLVGLAVVGVAIVRTSLRPLTDIERTAGRIASGDLSQRVPDQDPRTEVGRLGRSLNAMLSQIEAAFHARARSEASARRSEERMRQFVADASHELRTPLTAIRGYAEYYRQLGGLANGASPQAAPGAGQAGEPAVESAEPGLGTPPVMAGSTLGKADLDRIMQRVEQEASRMGGLVEDMLLLARVDQQRPFERSPVDMLTLAADAVQDARMIAPGRAIDLTVVSEAAFLVIGDEARLRQVVGNLMSNALTHTPDGTPVGVAIRSGALGGTQDRAGPPPAGAGQPQAKVPAVVLEVTDHGPGLTPEQAEHVFERFYRADQARTRARGGTGLGLAIVAALVAAHGGEVSVRSAPGQGATFTVRLPLAPEAAVSELPAAAPPPPQPSAAHAASVARAASSRDPR